MKKISLSLFVSLIVIFLITGIVFAALPGTGWQTSYSVMNINIGATSAGTFNMTAYDKDTTDVYSSADFSFDPKEALIYAPNETPNYPTGNFIGFSQALPSGFEGSVVLSSGVPIASAATLDNSQVTGGTAIGRYQAVGSDLISNSILFPSVKHNYFGQTTTFYVQAAGSDANVTITYKMNDGTIHTENANISANKMFMFDPANAIPPVASTNCGDNANTSPCFGAATLESTTGPIAGVVVESYHVGSPAPFALSTRGLANSDISTKVFAPTVKNYYYAATAGFTVMNTGSSDAYAQINLTVTGVEPGTAAAAANVQVGDTYADFEIIPPNSSVVFGPFNSNLGNMPVGTFAAASVESIDNATYDPQPLAAVSNEAKTTLNLYGQKAKAMYSGYAPSNATDKLSCPVVTEFVDGQIGGMTVVNVGENDTTIHFEYVLYNGATYHFWTIDPVSPGKAVSTNRISLNPLGIFTNDGSWLFSEMSNKVFSVYVYSSNGENIIALSQEASTGFVNDIRNYECVNILP